MLLLTWFKNQIMHRGEGEKGRREHCMINLCVQNSHKFAQNKPHTSVCDILCEFENVLF